MLIAGFLTDRFGRRATFFAGFSLFACVYLLYFLVASATLPPEALVVAQIVRGFAFASFTATALTMAIELSPPAARGRAAGLFSIAQSLSQIVGGYSGGPLAQALGFRALFGGAAAALVLGIVYLRVGLRPAKAGDQR
jgi:MFS family permease